MSVDFYLTKAYTGHKLMATKNKKRNAKKLATDNGTKRKKNHQFGGIFFRPGNKVLKS